MSKFTICVTVFWCVIIYFFLLFPLLFVFTSFKPFFKACLYYYTCFWTAFLWKICNNCLRFECHLVEASASPALKRLLWWGLKLGASFYLFTFFLLAFAYMIATALRDVSPILIPILLTHMFQCVHLVYTPQHVQIPHHSHLSHCLKVHSWIITYINHS